VVALVPGPGQVDRYPDRDSLVVTASGTGDDVVVESGAVAAGGVDRVDRGPQGVGDLLGPQLACRVDVVGVVQIPE
jgi:hypothetical protein